MRPICVKCHVFFRPIKNDYWFTEGRPVVDNPKPGDSKPKDWKPYKIWAADLYECPNCKVQILSGFGQIPLREYYESDFEDLRTKLKANQFQVNDC